MPSVPNLGSATGHILILFNLKIAEGLTQLRDAVGVDSIPMYQGQIRFGV